MDWVPDEEEIVYVRAGGGGGPGQKLGEWDQGYRGVLLLWVTVASTIKGTASSVPVESVQGLEHHHPTISTVWLHGDRSKRKKEIKLHLRVDSNFSTLPLILRESQSVYSLIM